MGFWVFALCLCLSSLGLQVSGKPIDDYVALDDGFFSWDEVTSYRYEGVTVYMVNMTSQKWLNESWSNTPIWTHPVAVAIPDTLRSTDTGFMFVLGTDYNDNPNIPGIPNMYSGYNLIITAAAREAGTVFAYVANIPNQPIVFTEDPDQIGRREDTQIAFTWRKFLYEDPDKPVQLNYFAMVKAASRGLTVVQDLAHEKLPFLNLTKFGALGGSKRGATSWLLGAVDPRIDLIAPIVFPLLNAPVCLMRHFRSLNGWANEFGPYYREEITPLLTGSRAQLLADEIDPYRFRDRLTMHKYVIAATVDEFFFPDEPNVWWDDMPEPKHLLMVANGNHVMSPRFYYVFKAVISYYLAYLEDYPFPTLSWTFGETETNGTVTISTDPMPVQVRGYAATSQDTEGRRDFRRRTINGIQLVNYRRVDVTDLGDGDFSITVPQPEAGFFTAFFIEAQFEGVDERNIVATSAVHVIPTELPFPECSGLSCYGELV